MIKNREHTKSVTEENTGDRRKERNCERILSNLFTIYYAMPT